MKNPCRLVAAVATLCLFAGAALAQTPAKSMKAPKGNGNGGGAGTVTGSILCDDPCNNAQYGFASQNFPDFPSFSSQTYGLCTVPDGATWNVDGFCADGFYNYSPHCPQGYFFGIVADLGCVPDCGNFLYYTEQPGPDPNIDTPDCLGLPDGRLCFCPGGEAVLGAGNWWFTAGVNMHFASPSFCGQWYWTGSNTPHRKACCPYLDNPGGGFGLPPCANWCTVLGLDQDMAFTVYGSNGPGCDCTLNAGNVDTGNGNPPVDVLFVNGDSGASDPCRGITVACNVAQTVHLDSAPSVNKGQYGLWVYGPFDTWKCDQNELFICGGKGNFDLGAANINLPVNNTCGGSVPCPTEFPVGRTTKNLGSGKAATLCLNKKPGFPKSPVDFSVTFTACGKYYTLVALVLDLNAPASAQGKNVAISNLICVCAL